MKRGELNCDAVLPLEPAADSSLAIIISPNGSLSFVWDDRLQPLCDLGQHAIARASHVEPIAHGEHTGQWHADMAPSGGHVLGPYKLHGEALLAEREWLRDHRGL